jgi:chromo domain-containing protein 1
VSIWWNGSTTHYIGERYQAIDGAAFLTVSSCTWEPSENLEGTSFLDVWNRRREQWVSNKRGEDFEQYIQRNIDEFEAAEREAERQKTQRQRKRAKKRRKLRSKVDDSNSEGDRPLIATRRLPPPKRTLREDTEDVSPIFVTQHQRPRKPPIDQSDDSSSPEGDDRNNLHQSKQCAERRSPKKRLESDDARRARQHQARSSKSAVEAEFVKPKNPSTTTQRAKTKKNARGPPTDASAVTASRKTSITSAQIPSPRIKTATLNTVTKPVSSAKAPPMPTATVGASPGPPVSKAVTSIKRTTTLRPIRIINQAPTNQRKEWQNSEGHYKKLTMRAKAAKRGRNEQKPDESVLQFVNGQPRWPPPVAASKSEARPADDVYGRRETRHVRRNSDDDHSTKNKQEILQDRLANKIPLTCFEWLNGSCERTAEQCRFHHTRGYRPSPYNGTVPGKYRTPPQTCIPWMENPKGCNKSEEECGFAHYNTGHLAQTGGRTVEMDINRKPKFLSNKPAAPFAPRSMLTCYFWLHSNCRSSAEECTFAHWDTGEYARAPGALEKETRTKRPQKSKSATLHICVSC